MAFNSIDITTRKIDTDIEAHLPEDQKKFLAQYQERLAGILIPENELKIALDEAANVIIADYKEEGISMITGVYVLTGARVIYSELSRRLFNRGMIIVEDNTEISRYGSSLSGGVPRINLDVRNVKPKDHVLVTEDVIDEGITLESLAKRLDLIKPESVKLFSLLFKPDKYEASLRIHYPIFKAADHWLVGMGMDLSVPIDGKMRSLYRELPFVAVANPNYLLKTGQINEQKAAQLKSLL